MVGAAVGRCGLIRYVLARYVRTGYSLDIPKHFCLPLSHFLFVARR